MSTNTADLNVGGVRRVTTRTFQEMKEAKIPISMLTAYDFTSASILDSAGIDALLVGDSASNVIAGHETTLPITLDHMIYHAQSVVRAVSRALVIVDLPFGSFQGNRREALISSIRIMKETGAHAVKLEGGSAVASTIRRIVVSGIPVMGHLGLTPQSIYRFGTYKVRAREKAEADELLKDAVAIQDAGCFAIVLEKIPRALAAEVTGLLEIPTIGIGAGPDCDGQILVTHDMLGLTTEFNPRFVRHYANLADSMRTAVSEYVNDVRRGEFPSDAESYE